MIPKIIHYCWFGQKPLPKSVMICLDSWRKHLPDYEIKEWNENNFEVNEIPFTREAYAEKKWAFVSDYARVKAVLKHGGFYLDTDMEVRNSLDGFLPNHAVCGFEIKGVPFSAFFGAEKGHEFVKDMVKYYEGLSHFDDTPNTKVFSKLLVEKYGAIPHEDRYQNLKGGINLYPSHYFSLDLPPNFIAHHFSGSWHERDTPNPYKEFINTYFYLKKISEIKPENKEINNVVYNHKLIDSDDILKPFPVRMILKHLLSRILKRGK